MSADMRAEEIEALLEPYLRMCAEVPAAIYQQLAQYLELIARWNSRTNLTSIRTPEEMVRRHFGESLFAAQQLDSFGEGCTTLLDFGSGAGFPGLPMQLLRPELRVTLAESQNKKATFLREVVRTLGLSTEVWAGRVEAMPTARRFGMVTMRAVDNMEASLKVAAERAELGLIVLKTVGSGLKVPVGFQEVKMVAMVGSQSGQICVWRQTKKEQLFHVEQSGGGERPPDDQAGIPAMRKHVARNRLC